MEQQKKRKPCLLYCKYKNKTLNSLPCIALLYYLCSMISKFIKGDKVFDYAYGWGEVYEIGNGGTISVRFTPCLRWYSENGCLGNQGSKPTLSLTEYTLNGFSQERPEPHIEENTLVYYNCSGKWMIGYFYYRLDGCAYVYANQKKGYESYEPTILVDKVSLTNPLLEK